MAAPRYAARRDANHGPLVKRWESWGGTWMDTSSNSADKGRPDGLAGMCGVDRLVEIKDGEKEPARKKLRDDQVDWHEAWQGQQPVVWETIDDVDAMAQEIRQKHAGRYQDAIAPRGP